MGAEIVSRTKPALPLVVVLDILQESPALPWVVDVAAASDPLLQDTLANFAIDGVVHGFTGWRGLGHDARKARAIKGRSFCPGGRPLRQELLDGDF
jgi:hypothetical protein